MKVGTELVYKSNSQVKVNFTTFLHIMIIQQQLDVSCDNLEAYPFFQLELT